MGSDFMPNYDAQKYGDHYGIWDNDRSPTTLLEIARLLVKDGFRLGTEADFDRLYARSRKSLMIAFDHPTDPKNYFAVADKGAEKKLKLKFTLREDSSWKAWGGWWILAFRE